jgi:hypothetical protein
MDALNAVQLWLRLTRRLSEQRDPEYNPAGSHVRTVNLIGSKDP